MFRRPMYANNVRQIVSRKRSCFGLQATVLGEFIYLFLAVVSIVSVTGHGIYI